MKMKGTKKTKEKCEECSRRKKKVASGAHALQSCDRGSHPSSFSHVD